MHTSMDRAALVRLTSSLACVCAIQGKEHDFQEYIQLLAELWDLGIHVNALPTFNYSYHLRKFLSLKSGIQK